MLVVAQHQLENNICSTTSPHVPIACQRWMFAKVGEIEEPLLYPMNQRRVMG